MTLDRRGFNQMFLLATGAGLVGFPGFCAARAAAPGTRSTLITEAADGHVVHRSGACATRYAPCSTFKIPLALMGFDAGILTGTHSPAWDYDPKRHEAHRAVEKKRIDPTSWERDSVIWYSREITRRLGAKRFADYVSRFGYGNRDVRGTPGKHDGLTHSWIGSSLEISADEQVAFLRRMLAHKFVSARAHGLTEQILPRFSGSGGWQVHGKTGTSSKDAQGNRLAWFVGWAQKGKRRVILAGNEYRPDPNNELIGAVVRDRLRAEIGALAG